MSRKPWNWLSFIAGLGGALVVLGGIWIGLAVREAALDADQERYERCLADLGFTRDNVTTQERLDELYIAATICS